MSPSEVPQHQFDEVSPEALTADTTEDEQRRFESEVNAVKNIVSVLRILASEDEDQRVALARLENWLAENEGRWVR